MPAVTAAALPPLLPPGVRSRFHGLRVTPLSGESVTGFQPNSGVVVLPKNTAPSDRSRAATGESSFHCWFGSMVREPSSRGQPAGQHGIFHGDGDSVEKAFRLAFPPARLRGACHVIASSGS